MSVTTIDQYRYTRIPQQGFPKFIRIVVDNKLDPTISDIESKLIDSDQHAFVEGIHFIVHGTQLGNIGSATVLTLEVEQDGWLPNI